MIGLWQIPIIIIIFIYLPASLIGGYILKDRFSATILALMALIGFLYYFIYPRFAAILCNSPLREKFFRLGERVNLGILAWIAISTYIASLIIAALTTEHTPLGAALLGGGELDIARARAEFLATRQGPESLLRYAALILGRAVMPFLIIYAFYKGSRWRYLSRFALLCCYLVGLEKGAAIFALAPLILFFLVRKNLWSAFTNTIVLVFCIGLWTFLATGGLDKSQGSVYAHPVETAAQETRNGWPRFSPGGSVGDAERLYLITRWIKRSDMPLIKLVDRGFPQVALIINRAIWIPYITAYDWLRFHEEIMAGELTYGLQIGAVSRLFGQPKLPLEQMVYDYQFGQPQAGAGASNTAFFIDAKVAFGWFGVVAYIVAYIFFSAIIFSSKNEVAQIASITSFYTAALSPLTATLLSGGLFFFIIISLFVRLDSKRVHDETLQTLH